jgi:hypothetical protein
MRGCAVDDTGSGSSHAFLLARGWPVVARVLSQILRTQRLLGAGAAREGVPVAADVARELARRKRPYRGERPPPDLRGRVVDLADDGLAFRAEPRRRLLSPTKETQD